MASTSKRLRPITELDFSSGESIPGSSTDNTDNEAFDTDSDGDEEPDYDANPPVWSSITNGMRPLVLKKQEELLISVPGEGRPFDFFSFLFDEICLENIVKFTNRNALDVLSSSTPLSPESRITKWKDLTVPELKTFIGLLLHTGTIKLPRLNDYWKTHRLFGLTCFSKYMSRDRFLLILRCLYFTDNRVREPNNRLKKIQFMIDCFNNKMANVYYPQKELSLDESMILWRGRLLFRQYIKGKKHKYGIKLYTLSDPHGLILKFLVYCGVHDDMGGKGHAANVVLKLMEGKLGKGHSLYMDNYYNSFALASKLLANETYCTGTIRMNRKYLPTDVKTANLKKGQTIGRYAEGVLVGKWKDKRDVSYISTEFENEMVEFVNSRGESRQKTLPIVKYNAFMKGVDRGDMMMAYYPVERKTLRWYKKLFVHVVHMFLLNSYLLCKKYAINNGNPRMTFYDFRLSVLENLLPKIEEPRAALPLGGTSHTLTKLGLKGNTNRTKTKNCRSCSKRFIRKMTRFVCEGCDGSPGLCPGACFDNYHK